MKPLEEINCPFCGKNEPQFWAQENSYTAVKCNHCGFVYVNPRPVLDSISEAAQTGLHETESGTLNRIGEFEEVKVRGYKKRLLELYAGDDLQHKDIAWLDVGSGFGELLLALKDIAGKGSILEGIEPCVPKVEKAQSLGLNVTSRSLKDIDRQYDVISLFNVFGHLPDPMGFISNLKQYLKENGEIFLVTGNGADLRADEYPESYSLPNHLVFGGEKHIRGIFERSGFEIVKLNKYPYWLPRKSDLDFLPSNMDGLRNLIKKAVGRSPSPYRALFVRARLV